MKSKHDWTGEIRAARKRYVRAHNRVRRLYRTRIHSRDLFAAQEHRDWLGDIWSAKQKAFDKARGVSL